MQGKMSQRVYQALINRAEPSLRMRRRQLLRAQSSHDAPEGGHGGIELRQRLRLRWRLGLGELALTFTDIARVPQFGTDEVIQVTCQVQDQVPHRVARLDR